MAKKIIAIGARFGKLVVERIEEPDRAGRVTVWCRCDCGGPQRMGAHALRVGARTVCEACPSRAHPNSRAAVSAANRSHGATDTTEWHIWNGIRRRCLDPKDKAYPRYGGRGITVCDRWVNGDGTKGGFECFLEDMGNRPSKRHTLDRWPDNDGGYSKDNCRWATWEQQNGNRRSVIIVDMPEGRMTLMEAARLRGVDYPRARERYSRLGWSLEDALGQPRQQGAHCTVARQRPSKRSRGPAA